MTIFKLLNSLFLSSRISSPSHQGGGHGASLWLSGTLLPAVVKLRPKCVGHGWLCLTVDFVMSLWSGLKFHFGLSLATRITFTLKFVTLFYGRCLTEMHSPQPTATAY